MQTCLAPEITATLESANFVRVKEIARELAGYGLAVAMPHLHKEDAVRPLPADMIQYENNLQVSFRDKGEFERTRRNGFPVIWRFNPESDKVEACAWCHDD